MSPGGGGGISWGGVGAVGAGAPPVPTVSPPSATTATRLWQSRAGPGSQHWTEIEERETAHRRGTGADPMAVPCSTVAVQRWLLASKGAGTASAGLGILGKEVWGGL